MRQRKQTSIWSSKGFSLPEVLTVIGVIAILAVIAIPNFASLLRNAESRSAARHAAAFLRLARSTAINTNTAQQVVFSANNYGMIAGTTSYAASFPSITIWNSMSSNISSGPAVTIQFTPNGVASLGTSTVDIKDNDILRFQVIVSATGRISVNGPM